MKSLTVSIPEHRLSFFLELLKQLDFPVLNTSPEHTSDEIMDIPEWEKEMVLDIQKNTPKHLYIDTEEIEKLLKFD